MAGVGDEVTDVTDKARDDDDAEYAHQRARAQREDAARADGGGAATAGQRHDQKAGAEERAMTKGGIAYTPPICAQVLGTGRRAREACACGRADFQAHQLHTGIEP